MRAFLPPEFQPTRPLRGATSRWCHSAQLHQISTHAPLAGRDSMVPRSTRGHRDFNPRAPCGARPDALNRINECEDFNPRAPCGARRTARQNIAGEIPISTHAPLAGRDRNHSFITRAYALFQPTRPLRGATLLIEHGLLANIGISTHAPLAGRDTGTRAYRGYAWVISTHAPLAGRDYHPSSHK